MPLSKKPTKRLCIRHRRRQLLLLLLLLFVIVIVILPLSIQARRLNNADDSNCIDLTDFFYDIVLALSTYPTAICSDAQQAEVSSFLQRQVNLIAKNTPGTINTQNKLCQNPINHRTRQRQLQQHRNLLMNFIYVGGGRCRYCFLDNYDYRFLISSNETATATTTWNENDKQDDENNDDEILLEQQRDNRRDLLYYYYPHDEELFPNKQNVSRIGDCHTSIVETLYENKFNNRWRDVKGWDNGKITKSSSGKRLSFLGPYLPGESFGYTIYARQPKGSWGYNIRENEYYDDKPIRKSPISEAQLIFHLWAIDIPPQYAKEQLGDSPLFILINGIKLDLALLINSPARFFTKRKRNGLKYSGGYSFAGIQWTISELVKPKNHGLGDNSGIDRGYKVEMTIPYIIFEHRNALDLKFIVNPEAKARQYGIDNIEVTAMAIVCNVIGLENTPFEEFKNVMEMNLKEKLGLNLAREFQSRSGHCLENKLPFVSVNLIQKTDWKEANPRCPTTE